MNQFPESPHTQESVQSYTEKYNFNDAPEHPYSSVKLSSASGHLNSSFLFTKPTKDFEFEMITPKIARNRRGAMPGEQVKHKRTRSGCLTCRGRRVKCDEGRPICERCHKGKRECVYSEPSSGSKSKASKTAKGKRKDGSPISDDDAEDGDETRRLGAIEESESSSPGESPEGAEQTSTHSKSMRDRKNSSGTPSLTTDGASPSTEDSPYSGSGASPRDHLEGKAAASRLHDDRLDAAALPPDVKFYLKYYVNEVTYHHYSMKADVDHILHNDLLTQAFRYDPLLQAITGFAAFHHTIRNPSGTIKDFLQYYNKAVTLLLRSLRTGKEMTVGTLLCMLQLAAIEELLGDWVNLLGHQRAACTLLKKLFTPQSVMETAIGRMILAWYSRFDLYGALIGGYRSSLPVEWLIYSREFYRRQSAENPTLENRIDGLQSEMRVIAMEIIDLSCTLKLGQITPIDYFAKENELSIRLEQWWKGRHPALRDPAYSVTDFSACPPKDPDDILDPYEPGIIFVGPLWPMTVLHQDFLGLYLMMKYTSIALKGLKEDDAEYLRIRDMAYGACQIFEAVELYPDSPKGIIVGAQSVIGMGGILFPKDDRHRMWTRRKLAVIECNGYVYSSEFRANMAKVYQDPSVEDWWLPKREGCPPILREIFDFVKERSAQPTDEISDDLKGMKQVFKQLSLDDE